MSLFMLSLLGLVPTFQKTKCKKLLNITMERIKLLKSRREAQLRQLRIDVAKLLQLGKEQKAQVWLGRIWKELCLLSVYIKIADYCQSVQINLKDIAGQRECPSNLEEPLAGLCFAASCCADLPELQELREILARKYGKHFVTSAQELQPDCHVNQEFLECLCAKDPSDLLKQALLEEITTQNKMKQGKEKDKQQQEIHDPSNRDVVVDAANDCNQSGVQQEEVDCTMTVSEVKDDKSPLESEKLQEMDVVQETDHAATVCEEDLGPAELPNCKRTLEGRQTRRSALKRAYKSTLAWLNNANEEEGNASCWEHEKVANKVRVCEDDEDGQGDKTGKDTGERLVDAHDDGYGNCGSLQGQGTTSHMTMSHKGYGVSGSLQGEGKAACVNEHEPPANEEQHIILYVEQPLFSRPPQRAPPPPPPPKRAPPPPPPLRVMSMASSQYNKQANGNTPLPLRCSTMANNFFLESYGGHVHPRLPKYEDLVANFTALKR